ncbi:hypothetical protein GW17_00060753 [Ensete ventricosum]|nr:hypothetical protein GW17_00060753 [Ensete ventricosum]
MQRQDGLWIQGVNVLVPQRRVFRVCASKLVSDESLGHQHMGVVVTGELDCFSAHIRLREPDKSEDKAKKEVDSEERHNAAEADLPIVKGYRCKATDSRAIGLIAPWYRRGGTSAEEVENAEANFKY